MCEALLQPALLEFHKNRAPGALCVPMQTCPGHRVLAVRLGLAMPILALLVLPGGWLAGGWACYLRPFLKRQHNEQLRGNQPQCPAER